MPTGATWHVARGVGVERGGRGSRLERVWRRRRPPAGLEEEEEEEEREAGKSRDWDGGGCE